MSSGFDSARAQILIELGLQGEGVADTAAQEIRKLQAAIAELNNQNREGITVGKEYLDGIRANISGINELTRIVRDATVAEREANQERVRNIARAMQDILADEKKTSRDRVQVIAQAMRDIIAEEKAAAAENKKYAKDVADNAAEMIRQNAAAQKADVDHANDLLKQRQTAVKLDAEVNSVIIAGAKAEHAELTRTIELQVNPRMAASEKYRQSLDDAVKATHQAKDAELEYAQAVKKVEEAQLQAEKAASEAAFAHQKNGQSNFSRYGNETDRQKAYDDHLAAIRAQVDAESDLVAADVKLAASQNQVATATKNAATAQKAMQTGTQAGSDKMMAWTRTVYFAAQGLEDLQYGFNAVVNNIPMVAMSIAQGLGASSSAAMAWAGGISLIAVGINSVLIPAFTNFVATHEPVKTFFDDLGKQLNPFHVDVYASALDRMNERIKELTSKKVKVAVDMFEVEQLTEKVKALQKATEEANAILNKQTTKEAQMGKNIATDLETEEGRAGFKAAQEKSVQTAIQQSQVIRDKRAEIQENEVKAERAKQAIRTATTAEELDAAKSMLSGYEGWIKKLRGQISVEERTIRQNEEGRFNLDVSQARFGTAVNNEQANAQGRMLANFRAAGQGALADKIEHDIANAQSGLGTQAEIEEKGRENASEQGREQGKAEKKEAESTKDQTVNKFASLYKTKEQAAVDKVVASAIIDKRAEQAVRAELADMFYRKMITAGIDPEIAKAASEQATSQAIDTSKANVMAAGDTPEAGASALLEKAAAKGNKKTEADQSKNQREANAAAKTERTKFGKPVDTQVQAFLASNQAEQEYQNRLKRSGPKGNAELRKRRLAQKKEGDKRRKEVSAFNKSKKGKAYIASLSPEEKAAEMMAQQIYMQTSPFAGTMDPKTNKFDPQAGAKAFATQGVENSMQVGGMPGADDPLFRNAQASEVVAQSQMSLNALIEGNMAQTGTLLEATLGAQEQLIGRINQQNARINRLAGMARNNHWQLNDLRQSAANTVD